MQTIRWGMIGCGDVTEVKSGPGFYKAKNSMLFGVTNRTLEKAYRYAERHPVKKVFPSAEALIQSDEIDAVYIATPPGSHKAYALLCAAAKKVCYIEKPLALTYEDGLAIQAAFDKTGTKAFSAYYRRRMPRFLEVKKLIDGGAVGVVRFVNVRFYRPPQQNELAGSWHVQPAISGGGIFMDIAVHALDALDFLLGPIIEATGVCVNQAALYAPEDIVGACFRFESGVVGTGVWCFTAGQKTDTIEIVGDKGRVVFGCHGSAPITLETPAGREEIATETPAHVHQNLIQSIVDELNGTDTCPSTLASAIRTARVCDMIYGRIYPGH